MRTATLPQEALLRELRTQLAGAQDARDVAKERVDSILDRAKRESWDFTKPDSFERIEGAIRERDAAIARVQDLEDRVNDVMKTERPVQGHGQDLVTRFVDSDAVKGLRERSSRITTTDYPTVHTDFMQVADSAETAKLLAGDLRLRDIDRTTAEGLIWSDRRESLVLPFPYRRVKLLDVMPAVPVTAETIEYAKEVTPGTGTQDNVGYADYGTALAESEYEWDTVTAGVKRVGHHVVATKGALADRSQLDTMLRGRLDAGVRRKVEHAAVNDLVATGLWSGLLEQVTATQALSTDPRADAIHKAATKIEVAGEGLYMPNAVLIHPNDYEKYVLVRDAEERYINGGPGSTQIRLIWDMIPVVSTVVPAGTALVGDFGYAVVWVREGIALAASDQHSDFFLKGLVAIKAEMRVGFTVLAPAAFCEVTGL